MTFDYEPNEPTTKKPSTEQTTSNHCYEVFPIGSIEKKIHDRILSD